LRLRLVLVASLLLILLGGAGVARASIKIYESSEAATLLGEVRKGKCKTKRTSNGKVFHGGGKATNGAYTLDVDIYDFRGFKREYQVPFGVINPTVNVESTAAGGPDFSNNYPFPGTPPPSAGAIAFGKRGAILGLGIYALPNPDYSQGVVLAGHMKCIYP
jgi:hypothetical protein